MDVLLLSDGRVFDNDGEPYEPGDVAWFEEDVLLVVAVKNGRAEAIEHPAASEMMTAALDGVKSEHVFAKAMRIHARTMEQWAALARRRAPAAVVRDAQGRTLGEAVADDIQAVEQAAVCNVCGNPATCRGEHDGEPTAGCDEHCGHGQEDGRCESIAERGAPRTPTPTRTAPP